MLKRGKKSVLPSHADKNKLADDFVDFFSEKVQKIQDTFPPIDRAKIHEHSVENVPVLNCIEQVTEDELRKIISTTKSKSCNLDPIPTTLLKATIDPLLPTLCKIVNKSIESNTFPDAFKTATVTPILKKPSLSAENMSNYRPVSGLAYVGKLIEKIVVTSFNNHITRHDLDEKYQSAYRPFHSVETVKVFNDVLISLENGKGVMLVLLDLSAAFDTVDPNILVERLENSFGITGSASEWT